MDGRKSNGASLSNVNTISVITLALSRYNLRGSICVPSIPLPSSGEGGLILVVDLPWITGR